MSTIRKNAPILILSATYMECDFLVSGSKQPVPGIPLRISGRAKRPVDLLVTGPGLVPTAFHLTRTLLKNKYSLVLNIGICGSLHSKVTPLTQVHVISESFADFGAEDGDFFLDMFQLGFAGKNEFPYTNGWLLNKNFPKLRYLKSVVQVKGVSVQKAHGKSASIRMLRKKYGNVVESMEGAAAFYVCMQTGTPVIQYRVVSNMVERRNRKKWLTGEAIHRLSSGVQSIIEELQLKH